MLGINLLPIAERKHVRLEQWRRLLIFLTLFAGIVLVFSSVFLLPSFLPMFFEQRELQRFIKLEGENYKNLKIDKTLGEIKSLKSKLALIRGFIEKPYQTSLIMEDILQMAGPKISIRQISFSDSGTVSINGTATSRKDLIFFEDTLKNYSRLTQISSPLSDIVRGAASFTIQGQLKKP